MKKYLLLGAFITTLASVVVPGYAQDLGELVGYTIIGQYHITGWRDQDGKKGDSYEGCNFGRVLILDDRYVVTCSGYWYEYAYRPAVIVLKNGARMKIVLNGNVRDVQ